MCLGTLSVLHPVNLVRFYCFLRFIVFMFLLKSMALMVEIPNSWVYELPTEKCFVTFFSGEHLNFWTSIFRQKRVLQNSPCQQIRSQVYQEANYQFFLKTIQRLFLKFYMKLEDLKGQKLMEPVFFRKILVLGKKPKISLTTGIFYFCQKISPFMFLFFTQK